jgi:hypothetical protein
MRLSIFRLPLVVSMISVTVIRHVAGGELIVTHHDGLGRLTNAAYSDDSRESYSHDYAGNRLTRITLAPTVQSDTVRPSVPPNFTTEEISPTELRLSWNRAFDTGGSGLAGYFVYLNGVMVVNTSATNCILTGLLANTPYSITIAAYDRAANISDPGIPIEFFHLGPPSLRDPGLTNGILGFTLHGAIGSNYVVQASSNLVDWESISTDITLASSTLPVSDPDATNHTQRFYRALQSTNEPPEPSELIVNGSFENPIPGMAENGAVKLFPGDTRLYGWMISGTGGPVDCSISGAQAGDGTNDLTFNSGNAATGTWITQTFRTVPGIAYSLTFLVGRVSGGSGDIVRLRASVESQTSELLGSDVFAPPEQGHWTSRRIDFTATSTTTTVTFLDASRDTVAVDLLLDGISVRRMAL